MSDKNAFYSKLKGQLEDTTKFPADYMYKFIVPSDENQLEEVQNVFDNTGAVITTKNSKRGKYISITIVVKLKSADDIIMYYKKVEKIKGIISL
ncbi:MAG: putative lipoic acid-binding regulatory protein [Polaribacter sp.]|jgi:putative lipoic acid-binding regulatory protein